jgi:hypothetical protein
VFFSLSRIWSDAVLSIKKYPAFCPVCHVDFPENPSKNVKKIYEKLQAHLRQSTSKNAEPKGANMIRFELCIAIQADLDFQNNYPLAALNGWPGPGLDFNQVYRRILDLNKDKAIWGLLSNDIVLRNSIAWCSFINQITDAEQRINGKIVKCNYTLSRFLLMPTMKQINIIDSPFGG